MLNDYLKSINKSKEDIMVDDYTEKQYNPYITNHCLSGFIDTIFQSNEMNRFSFLDKRLQYDYLRFSIRQANRFTPWLKQVKDEQVEAVKEYFQYNRSQAEKALSVMSKDQIEYIIKYLDRGGFVKTKVKKRKNKEI